jgi:acyl-CoA synthetase (AMP-forming)/AMP-acid ligase II
MYPADTVPLLLARGEAEAPAIAAPERTPLTFAGLRQLTEQTVDALNRFGIGRGDRVAIVLANGPELAAAFVAIASGATTAPLNPAYRTDEFDFYLSDLGAKALILLEGAESPARAVAAARGVPVISLVPDPSGPAGLFTLRPASPLSGTAASPGLADADDIALVLHTSGTTARPKIVPLRQRNITASAYHIGEVLKLGPTDRCLDSMPLFHIHGLMASTLASLAAGGSVACPPSFNALRFFHWLEDTRPTWYTAVPTMHQAILTRADRHVDTIRDSRLRLVRSSSSSLTPQVMRELEQTFGVPVIEAYGMTEAAHQMTSNPLPPAPRYAGSVGVAAGPEVAIMNESGQLQPTGSLGEVVIRGRNVTSGYADNPEANARAFTNGWFHTGDQGTLDDAGYLRLTGRLKELINRGGEKISPLEVDAVLMDHPAVAQGVCFAVPHPMLGEDIAAAIVLRPRADCNERAIRDFVSERLAPFKVPRQVVFLDEIPKGPTGKVQRITLATQLGIAD